MHGGDFSTSKSGCDPPRTRQIQQPTNQTKPNQTIVNSLGVIASEALSTHGLRGWGGMGWDRMGDGVLGVWGRTESGICLLPPCYDYIQLVLLLLLLRLLVAIPHCKHDGWIVTIILYYGKSLSLYFFSLSLVFFFFFVVLVSLLRG